MSFPAPLAPEVVPEQAAVTRSIIRYEDCAQDGRIMPIALPNHMSGIWAARAVTEHARVAVRDGVVPILTRMVLVSEPQPIRVDRLVESRSAFVLAHARGDTGEVARVHMNLWTEVWGVPGRIHDRHPDAPLALAGRVFAEHTFTRLLAPPDQRKVLALPDIGVPPGVHQGSPPAASQGAPDGARWIDDVSEDPTLIVFTLDQTDGNLHVNSLVYVRTFLDAAQRRFSFAGRSLVVKSRAIDISYRKPCFAGDRVRVQLRLFQLGDDIGAAGAVLGTDDKPRCYVRAIFTR